MPLTLGLVAEHEVERPGRFQLPDGWHEHHVLEVDNSPVRLLMTPPEHLPEKFEQERRQFPDRGNLRGGGDDDPVPSPLLGEGEDGPLQGARRDGAAYRGLSIEG